MIHAPRENGPTGSELRAIPMETLRTFILDKVEERSIRTVAEEMRIGRSTLHKFVLGRTLVPQPRVRRLFALWYLRETKGAPVYADACNTLLASMPVEKRANAEPLLLQAVRQVYVEVGAELPEWMGLLKESNRTGPVL
jgi:hypothetical protein